MSIHTDKNIRRVDPFFTTEAYYQGFDKHQNTLSLTYEDGSRHAFQLLKNYEDKDSGFIAKSFINPEDGHAILLYKGMDVPFRNQGDGPLGFLKDVWTIAQNHLGISSVQEKQAEQAYIETVNNPAVKDMEVAGFSMGSLFTNYMAARYGAKATVSADLGLSDITLTRLFNERARNEPGLTRNSLTRQMRDNIVVLKMNADLLPQIFAASASRGRVIELDPGLNFDLSGIEHRMGVYFKHARQLADAGRDRGIDPGTGLAPA